MDQSPKAQPEDPPDSQPLVSLVPSQKRQALDPESGFRRVTTDFKSPRRSEILKPVARHARNPWLADASSRMHARRSYPGQAKGDPNIELRGTKSAPDLREPLLAAIRGLKDGSIQVDVRTRTKIADAARRVLEARELRRRTSQEAYQSQGASASQTHGADQQAEAPPVNEGVDQTLISPPRNVDSAASLPAVPNSLISSPSFRDLPRAEYRRPTGEDVEETLLPRFGELRTSRASPFTVTTGLPRFPPGSSSDGPQTPTLSAPMQARSRSTPIPVFPVSRSSTLASLPRSLDFVPELSQASEKGLK